MPSGFAMLDTSFPDLAGKTTEEKLQSMTDYLYQLLEQLRYTLHNLGAENFNETGLNEITQPIYADIRDVDGNVADLDVLANEIRGQVTDAQGNYTVMNLRPDGLHIGNAAGTTTIDGGNITANSIHLARLGNDVTGSFGDANPAYIKSTYIDFRQVSSPAVYAGDFYGALYHDMSGASTMQLVGGESSCGLRFAPNDYADAFRVDYEAAGDSTDAELWMNGKQLAYVNSRLAKIFAGGCWSFADGGICVPYGAYDPNNPPSGTTPPGQGKTGAVFFRI